MDDELYESEPDEKQAYGDPKPKSGELLTKKDAKAAKYALAQWEAKNDLLRKTEARWEVNELRRQGWKNVQLRRETDDNSWFPWMPPHLENRPDSSSAMNKAATLCRRFGAMMFADPPGPQCMPATGEEEDRDAAEFSTRALENIQSEGRLNEGKAARIAFDRGSTYGSGFILYYVHPTAGGRMPVQISARPQARTVDEALLDADPETGEPWTELTERYVTEDGTLTDEPNEAAERNVPDLKREVLTGRNVRMIPHTAEDIWQADGVQIATFKTWGELRRTFPDKLNGLSEEDQSALFGWKPKRYKALATLDERRTLDQPPDDDDEKLVFCLTTYYTNCDDYPKGAYAITLADRVTCVQQEWTEEDGAGREITLMLPLTQYKQWTEGSPDPYGFGMMDLVGEGNEIRAHMINAFRDHVDRQLNRKVFLPLTSMLQPKDFRLPGNTPIYINPGGEPKYEEIPSFPNDGQKLISMTSDEMEEAPGLGKVAQGLESSQVQSGRHAQAIISQVHSGLSDIRQNIEDAYVRSCRIQLQLIRVFFDAPQRIGWVGEDGAFKERRWSNTDLRNTWDVKLKPGTLTMLAPIQKAALAQQYAQMGTITQEDLAEITASEVGGTIGLQDDPFRMRIRRQIAKWLEGPPDNWQPEMADQPSIGPDGQPIVDPQTGQPQMEQVQVPDPVLLGIFRQIPADELPYIARTRLREISKAMMRVDYSMQTEQWQFGLIAEFGRMKMAQEQVPGQQVGQPPNQQQSPAQQTDGPMAPPDTPVPQEIGPGTVQ